MNSRVPLLKKTHVKSEHYGGLIRVQLPPAPPKFFRGDTRIVRLSPKSPHGASPAGFFVSAIYPAKSEPN